MTVEEMLSRISSLELAEWMAYDRIEPIDKGDLHTAMLLTLTANANRDPEAQPEPFTVEQFFLDYWKRPEPEDPDRSWKANLQKAELITIAMGGQDLRKKD